MTIAKGTKFRTICLNPNSPLNDVEFLGLTYAGLAARLWVDEVPAKEIDDLLFGALAAEFYPVARAASPNNTPHPNNAATLRLAEAQSKALEHAVFVFPTYDFLSLAKETCLLDHSPGFEKESEELQHGVKMLSEAIQRFQDGEYRLGDFPQQALAWMDKDSHAAYRNEANKDLSISTAIRAINKDTCVDYTRNPALFAVVEDLCLALQKPSTPLPPSRRHPVDRASLAFSMS